MTDPVLQLDTIIKEAKKIPAFTVEGKDSSAYNSNALDNYLTMYTVPETEARFERKLSTTPHASTSKKFNVLSESNLSYMYSKTQDAIAKGIKLYGKDTMDAVIDAAIANCTPSTIILTHDPSWNEEEFFRKNSLNYILRDKALKAPHYIPDSPDDTDNTFISCGMIPNEKAELKYLSTASIAHFKIKSSPDTIKRSMAVVDFFPSNNPEEVVSLGVGGEHFQAAWLLATINNILTNPACAYDIKDIPKAVEAASENALVELKVPRQLSIVGASMITDDKIEVIKSSRVASKSRPDEKRDLRLDPGNPNLRNKPRSRGKSDD